MTDWTEYERARDRADQLRAIRIYDTDERITEEFGAMLRRSVWKAPRRLMSLLGDAVGCAVLFGLLWAALAILT